MGLLQELTIDLNRADPKKMETFYEILNRGKFAIAFRLDEHKNHYTLLGKDVDIVIEIARAFDFPMIIQGVHEPERAYALELIDWDPFVQNGHTVYHGIVHNDRKCPQIADNRVLRRVFDLGGVVNIKIGRGAWIPVTTDVKCEHCFGEDEDATEKKT